MNFLFCIRWSTYTSLSETKKCLKGMFPLKDYKEKLGACPDISTLWRRVFEILKQRIYRFEPESTQLIRLCIVLTISIFYYPDYVVLPFLNILYAIHFKRLIAKRSTTFMILMARIKIGSTTFYVSVADLVIENTWNVYFELTCALAQCNLKRGLDTSVPTTSVPTTSAPFGKDTSAPSKRHFGPL